MTHKKKVTIIDNKLKSYLCDFDSIPNNATVIIDMSKRNGKVRHTQEFNLLEYDFLLLTLQKIIKCLHKLNFNPYVCPTAIKLNYERRRQKNANTQQLPQG